MYFAIFGLAGGIGLPMQTSINAQLGRRMGSPFTAAVINFSVGTAALILVSLLVEHGFTIDFAAMGDAPPWIFIGGLLGAFFVVGNILLMPRLGSIQTVILPALGQIIMGTLIDTFGWFSSEIRSMSLLRLIGVAMVFGGVIMVVLSKSGSARGQSTKSVKIVWMWRIYGIVLGMCMATQTAVNTHLGAVIDSKFFAATINFSIGLVALFVVFLLLLKTRGPGDRSEKAPVWIWAGGLLGALFVVGNIVTAQAVGTGMAVVVLLIGMMGGGLIVDQFGLFRSAQRPVKIWEIIGVVIMIAGAGLFHLA